MDPTAPQRPSPPARVECHAWKAFGFFLAIAWVPLRCPRSRRRYFFLQQVRFGPGLALDRLAVLFVFLKVSLDLRVELIHFFRELRFSVGLSLGMLCFHLGKVGFHSVDIFGIDGILDVRNTSAEHCPANRLHAGINRGCPILLNLSD